MKKKKANQTSMSLEEAKRRYVHRFTKEHVPGWAKKKREDGTYYAPQYASDKEWYDNTLFPPDPLCFGTDCCSTNQTWPLGKLLAEPYKEK